MIRSRELASVVLFGLMLVSCAARPKTRLIDPFPLRFPLVEAGQLDIDGHVAGQPRARDGVVYYATREGSLTAVVVPSQTVLWRFNTDHPVSSSPEMAGETILLRDNGGGLYVVLARDGRPILKKKLDEVVTTAVRVIDGAALFGTAGGKVLALDPEGRQVWEYRPSAPAADVTAGPVPVHGKVGPCFALFGRADGLLMAVDPKGRPVWEFKAGGAIEANPAAAGGRVYFGDAERMFYCLDAATGKVKWRRRLQGAALHPAVIGRGTVAVAASNSVVYRLSRKGGSILSWEAIPSRVVYEPAAAGPALLVASAAEALLAFDPKTGKRIGRFATPGTPTAGALWVPPFVVLFEESPDGGGRERILFLRTR